ARADRRPRRAWCQGRATPVLRRAFARGLCPDGPQENVLETPAEKTESGPDPGRRAKSRPSAADWQKRLASDPDNPPDHSQPGARKRKAGASRCGITSPTHRLFVASPVARRPAPRSNAWWRTPPEAV